VSDIAHVHLFWSTAQQRQVTTLGLHLLWRAIGGIQNGLIRDVVCATTQICAGSQVNQLEALLMLCKDDIHGLDVSVYQPGCMEGLHSISRTMAHACVDGDNLAR